MITKEQAISLTHGDIIYTPRILIPGGLNNPPHKYRVTGKIKTWKTRPKEFRLPIKHGLYDYGYLRQDNAFQFYLTEEEAESNSFEARK